MGNIVTNRARVDKLLTNVSIRQNVEGLIAEDVLTFVNVVQTSGLLGKYDKSNLRIEHDIVGGETPYPRVSASIKSTERYSLEKHGLSGIVTEEQKENEEQPFDARKDITMDLTDKIKLGREIALATSLTTSGNYSLGNTAVASGGGSSPDGGYADYTNSTPLEDFNKARNKIFENSGQLVEQPGGFAIVPWQVWNQLKFHPDIIENIKHVVNLQKGLTFDQLKDSMGVDRILVPFSRQNTAKEGQTDVLVPVWGENIVFGFAPKTGTKKIETLGFRIQKRSAVRVFVNQLENPPNADEILVDVEYDFFFPGTGFSNGYLITQALGA